MVPAFEEKNAQSINTLSHNGKWTDSEAWRIWLLYIATYEYLFHSKSILHEKEAVDKDNELS